METTTINCEALLDTCWELIWDARSKANYESYRPNYQLHIVLPSLHLRALYLYLSPPSAKSMFVFGTTRGGTTHIFGALIHTSDIIREPIVY